MARLILRAPKVDMGKFEQSLKFPKMTKQKLQRHIFRRLDYSPKTRYQFLHHSSWIVFFILVVMASIFGAFRYKKSSFNLNLDSGTIEHESSKESALLIEVLPNKTTTSLPNLEDDFNGNNSQRRAASQDAVIAAIETIMFQLPTSDDLERLSDHAYHNTPNQLVRAAHLISKMEQLELRFPQHALLVEDFYLNCMHNEDLPEPLRALCLEKYIRISELDNESRANLLRALPNQIRRLYEAMAP